jgi:hypothetical protein
MEDYVGVAANLGNLVTVISDKDEVNYQASFSLLMSFTVGLIVGSSISSDKILELLNKTPGMAKE